MIIAIQNTIGAIRSFVESFASTKSVAFDGTDDYMDIGNVLNLGSTTDFSISFWVKVSQATNNSLLGKRQNSSNNWKIVTDSSDKIKFEGTGSGTVRFTITYSGSALAEGSWNHIVVSCDRSNDSTGLNLYVNKIASTPVAASEGGLDNTGGLRIGAFSTTFCLDGTLMDEVAIYNAALSSADVDKLYNSGKPTDLSLAASYDTDRTSNLLSWWRMGDGTGDNSSTIVDQAGSNNGTLVNSPTIVTDVP
tara:strand:- start:22742 stop:23488 length:747 start_codon:yes stop_codon:yes gene_type:complete